jgi:hypothetical protein
MVQNTMPMSNNPEKNNKLELDLKLKDGDDIPFILCTPILLNENDDAAQAQDNTTDADEADSPKEHKTFFLNPRRSSCQCASCRDKKVVGPTANAEMLSKESSLSGMGKGAASTNESLDCNTLHSSPRSSPVPILQSPFDVMVTPRVINLLKIQRASQKEEHHQEEDDDDDEKTVSLPLFPILGRQDNHHLQPQQQQQQQHPVIRRPIPRYRR